ncbi:presqualene diphosphate synthase HpnD [Caulobacter sp. KR2-114]|uniref:presqualene diphosphate synthase HpnD n=1 Tax=Caulobacter sp. KR2-114 TaxID=3400912 RepID=UPI003BFA9D42
MTVTMNAPEQPAANTEQQASGSSFYTAMRLLPPLERTAIFAVYAFCREVDDIADEPGMPIPQRQTELDAWRADLAALYAGTPPERTSYLVEPVRRFGLRLDDFLAIVDGMEMDVVETIRAPDYPKLDLYCERVATAVGRLSVCIFGMDEQPGRDLAHHLGRGLQLTNILRDLDEDAAMGRLYMPAEALAAAGIDTTEPTAVVNHPNIDTACRWVAVKAHEHYRAADAIMQRRPKGKLRTPRLMSAVYGQILSKMEAAGWKPPRARARIGKVQLIWTLLRHGLVE